MPLAIFHFLWALTWCAILVIGFIGWGRLVLKYQAGQVPSIGLAACVGLSGTVFLGGLLNISHLIFSWILISFTLTGVGLAIGQIIRQTGKNPAPESSTLLPVQRAGWSWRRAALLCFVFLFLFRMASTPRVVGYAREDDEHFYLAAPVKMMEMHYLAPDPFSQRRITSSVGGNYFLQGLVLSFLPLQNVQMADQFLGLVLIVLVSKALARQFELSPLETVIFGIFSISIPPMDRNLTFTVLPSAIFLAMVLAGTTRESLPHRPALQAFLVGLLAGTVCSLKSTYLPHAALFCFVLYLLRGFEKGWKFALSGWAFALIGALLIMVPWMAAMRETSGTYLYPIFGTGYDYSSYHTFPAPYRTGLIHVLLAAAIFCLPLTAIIFFQLFLLRREGNSLVLLAMTVACLLGTMASDFSTGGDSVGRFNFPIVIVAILLTYLQFSRERRLRPDWKPGRFLQAGSIAVLVLASAFVEFGSRGAEYSTMWHRIRMSLYDPPVDSAETRQEYAQIGAALPKDGLILTTLQHPYLLDHLDQHILLADWPGCASLPPGWPIKKDGEALAEFLLSHSIRYLAYTANSVLVDYSSKVTSGSLPASVLTKSQCESYLLATKQYLELKQSRRIIYDDGKVFIVDLSSRGS